MTEPLSSRSDTAALLELAATWCDGQVRGAYGATANEWFHRAAQLRAGAAAVSERGAMRRWLVRFDENGGEYEGSLTVDACQLDRDPVNEKCFFADGVAVEIDEQIINVEELPYERHRSDE